MIVLYGIIVHQKNSNLLKNARIEADGIITGLRKKSSRNILYSELGWLPLCKRRERQTLSIILYDCLWYNISIFTRFQTTTAWLKSL